MRSYVAALACAVPLAACGGEDGARDETAPPPSAPEAAAPAPDAAGSRAAPAPVPLATEIPPEVFLVEVVFEVGFAPRAGPAAAPPPRRDDAHGYVLRRLGPTLPPLLYPARGRPWDPNERCELWVARRVRSHPLVPAADSPALEAADSGTHRLAFGGDGPLPELSVELSLGGGGRVTARSGDAERAIAPGETALVARAETAAGADDLRQALFAAWRDGGVSALPSRDRVSARLAALTGDDGVLRLHAGLVVRHRGPVALGGFDVRHEREEARRHLRDGPYELAEEALANVLEALPEDAEALAAWRRLGRLLDAGASAGRLRGTLRFPDGLPTGAQRALWRDFHAGFAWLETPGDPTGGGSEPAPIEDGTFVLHAPTGEYRLRVAVPGFAPAERPIALEADTAVDLRLEAP